MIVAIHQPLYLPWLGFFGKILQSDAFVILDTVQYVKNEWENRNRVRTPEGWQWLTVPVEYRFPQSILETRINNREPWQRKHLKTLRQLYGKAPCFSEIIPHLEPVYERSWERLAELNLELIRRILNLLGVEKPLYRASEMNIPASDSTDRLIRICSKLDASVYLSGSQGRVYMDLERFSRSGIEVKFQGFEHPRYTQAYPGFESALSTVDMLFCAGPASVKKGILEGNRVEDR
jgi:hypothetical protein